MQTAKAKVRKIGGTDEVLIRSLCDCGSHRSYVTEKLKKRLQLKTEKTEELSVITFGSGKAKKISTTVCSLEIVLKDGTTKKIFVNVVPEISGPIHRTSIDVGKLKSSWKDLELADTWPTKNEQMTIHLLIGSDYYFDLL